MSGRTKGRRRGLALVSMAACALSLILAVPGLVTGAGANVGNPGNVQVSVDISILTPTLTLSGISTQAAAPATIAPNGTLFVPRAGLVFGPLAVNVGSPNPAIGDVTVEVVATSDFFGSVNPATRGEWLAGNLELLWSQPGTMTACPIGPFPVRLTTNSVGSRPYSDNGTATLVDTNFAVGAISPGTAGCGGLEGAVNTTLSLPIIPPTTTSGTGATTTTTTVPTSTTLLSDPVPDTPVPTVVLSTTLIPAPRPATPRPTTPTTSPAKTVYPPLTNPTATTTMPNAPPTNVVTPAQPLHPITQPDRHAPPRRKHHRKRHTQVQTHRPAAAPGSGIGPSTAAPKQPGFFPGTGANQRRPMHPVPHPTTQLDPVLVASRHRASPSGLNYLAMLALLVTGAYAVKLLSPDFKQIMRALARAAPTPLRHRSS